MSTTERTDPTEQRVIDSLESLGAAYEVVEVDPELADTADFCANYGYALEDSANCIVVASRTEPVEYAACVVLATTKLDVNKRVRKLMGVRKLSFATAEQTRDLTGMEIGGVTPFALPAELPLYIDERVLERDTVIVGGGSRAIKIDVAPEALTKLPAAAMVDIAVASG